MSGRRAEAKIDPELRRQLSGAAAAEELGVAADDYDFNVFPNLGYFVLSASPGFVERTLDQPEIASASANRRKG